MVENKDNLAHMINELLIERQQLLTKFCQVAGLDVHADRDQVNPLLQRFCEILVDYSALWHFEIYKYIRQHDTQYAHAMQVASELEGRIVQSSELAVAFNDKYDASDHPLSFEDLERDLSRMGEEIAIRIEAEDRILSAMSAS